MDSAAFRGLVYVLLAAGFAAFSFAQIAHTQDYYVQGLGVMPVTSSQYSFVRSYGTSLIPLALYSLYSSLQVRISSATLKFREREWKLRSSLPFGMDCLL
jgi:hypothetical protein